MDEECRPPEAWDDIAQWMQEDAEQRAARAELGGDGHRSLSEAATPTRAEPRPPRQAAAEALGGTAQDVDVTPEAELAADELPFQVPRGSWPEGSEGDLDTTDAEDEALAREGAEAEALAVAAEARERREAESIAEAAADVERQRGQIFPAQAYRLQDPEARARVCSLEHPVDAELLQELVPAVAEARDPDTGYCARHVLRGDRPGEAMLLAGVRPFTPNAAPLVDHALALADLIPGIDWTDAEGLTAQERLEHGLSGDVDPTDIGRVQGTPRRELDSQGLDCLDRWEGGPPGRPDWWAEAMDYPDRSIGEHLRIRAADQAAAADQALDEVTTALDAVDAAAGMSEVDQCSHPDSREYVETDVALREYAVRHGMSTESARARYEEALRQGQERALCIAGVGPDTPEEVRQELGRPTISSGR